LGLVKLIGHYARKDDDKRDGEFEEGCEDNTELALSEAFGGERSLGDELVQAPVVEVWNPDADDKGGPGYNGVACGEHHVKFGGVYLEEAMYAADGLEAEYHSNCAAEDECGALKEVGPGDCC